MRCPLMLALLLLFSACLISGDVVNSSINEHHETVSIPRGATPLSNEPEAPTRRTSWHVERTWYKKQLPPVDNDKPWPLLTPKWTEKTVFLQLTRRDLSEDEDLAEELSVEVSYEDIYSTLVFLAVTWVMGQLSMLLGMPSLVGEICAGFLLGPPLAGYVPYPEAMVLIGEIGLLMLLLEAGIEVDIAQLKETGVRSVGIAITGVTLSLGIGMLLAVAIGEPVKSSFAVGACFAPTSIGVASNALSAGHVLNTPVGQLIIAAGVIDDILGLILLAMLEVVVKDDAKIYEYFIPIISSVGYLVVLGGSALTWMPKVIENHYLPLFKEKHREMAAMGLMMGLVLAYLPVLYYSKSSYLTGAFLAGLTFSQIDSIHASFVQTTQHIMAWLLRIFFAASIGFQVPIKMFGDGKIIGYGFLFYVAVLAKLPLGFFAPKFQTSVPEGFPYNPYTRDVVIVGLAMSCRGEFSFIIAAFSLGEGLLNAELYSSIVFAVLLSCITSPFALLTAIKYYNKKSAEFLDSNPLLKDDADLEETIPLYLAIQARTENQWGLQEKFRKSAKKLSLDIIDHRSWHPRGADAVVVTEMYVQDTLVRIHNPAMYMKTEATTKDESVDAPPAKDSMLASTLNPRSSTEFVGFDVAAEDEAIDKRIEEVREGLLSDLGPDSEAEVLVSQWNPHVFQTGEERAETTELLLSDEDQDRLKDVLVHLSDEDRQRILQEVNQEVTKGRGGPMDLGPSPPPPPTPETPPPPRFHRVRTRFRQTSAPVVFADQQSSEMQMSGSVRRIRQLSHPSMTFIVGDSHELGGGISQPLLSHDDLWDIDEKAQDAAAQGVMAPQEQIDLTGGPVVGVGRRRKVKSDLSGLMNAGPTVEERLGGYVRRDLSKDTRRRQAQGQHPQSPPSSPRFQRRKRQTSFPPPPQRQRQTSYPPMGSTSQTGDMMSGGNQAVPLAPPLHAHVSDPPMPTVGENDPAPPMREPVVVPVIPETEEDENEEIYYGAPHKRNLVDDDDDDV